VAGGTFLSLIPLLTEAEAPFYVSIPLHHTANLILWVILDPPPKTALSTVENNMVVYPLGYHHSLA
jgi:hypothetical protein